MEASSIYDQSVAYQRGEYEISTERKRLDLDVIHGFLSTAYWSEGVARERVEKSIDGSMSFGLYREQQQIGFARVITDHTTFAYMADVFVLEAFRGLGLGKWLIETIVGHPELQDLRRFLLFTESAHKFYEPFGFRPLEGTQFGMHIYSGSQLSTSSSNASAGVANAVLPATDATDDYRPRRTQFVGVREVHGWQLKVYVIFGQGAERQSADTAEVVDAALRYASNQVPWNDDRATPYGFITIHFGEQATWLLVDLWTRDILKHFVYCAPVTNPTHFVPGPRDGTNSCVWELEVTKYERDVWVDHVLADSSNPAFARYLDSRLEVSP